MNKQQLRFIYKLLVFTLLFFLGCGFQTSFWPNLISFMPGPQIWLIILMFITIKWKSIYNIFFIYFLTYCLTAFSDIPVKMLWCTWPIIYFVMISVKNRIQLSGVFSFIVFTFAGSLLFEVSYYVFSDMLETAPTTVMFLDRFIQVLTNFIFSYFVYFILEIADRMTLAQEDWRDSSVKNHNPESVL